MPEWMTYVLPALLVFAFMWEFVREVWWRLEHQGYEPEWFGKALDWMEEMTGPNE